LTELAFYYCRKQVAEAEAEKEGVKVPRTLEEYCAVGKPARCSANGLTDMNYNDDYNEDDYNFTYESDDKEACEYDEKEDEEDSGEGSL